MADIQRPFSPADTIYKVSSGTMAPSHNPDKKASSMFRLIMGALALFMAISWFFAPDKEGVGKSAPDTGEPKAMAAPASGSGSLAAATIGNGIGKVVIPRSEDGHFYTDAQVGATTVRFLIDTGATAVALSRADAQRAGIFPSASEFTGSAKTANGEVALKPVTIDRIRIGSLEARNVEGAVIDGDMPVSLLGQSWLRNVGTVTIRDDKLILN